MPLLSASRKSWLGRQAKKYHESLTEEAVIYLKERGIERGEIDSYQLGSVVDPDPEHQPYSGRLSIPYITPSGVVALKFRCLEDHHASGQDSGGCPKYLVEGGKGETFLYNVLALHQQSDVVAVCEGELDALVCTVQGIPAVGVPGATQWQPHWRRLFEDYDQIIVLGDGDKAGREFAKAVLDRIHGAESRVLPEGHDVNSYVLEFGTAEFLGYALA